MTDCCQKCYSCGAEINNSLLCIPCGEAMQARIAMAETNTKGAKDNERISRRFAFTNSRFRSNTCRPHLQHADSVKADKNIRQTR